MRFMAKPGHLFGSVPSYNKLAYYPQNTLDFIFVFKDFDSIFTHTLKPLSQLGPPSPYSLADAFTRVGHTREVMFGNMGKVGQKFIVIIGS
jgi:hypothetical protein